MTKFLIVFCGAQPTTITRMYRVLLRCVVDGFILGTATVASLSMIARHPNISLLIGVVAVLLLMNMIRLIPILRIESLRDELRRVAKEQNDSAALEVIDGARKPTKIFSVQTLFAAVVLLAIGLVMRFLR